MCVVQEEPNSPANCDRVFKLLQYHEPQMDLAQLRKLRRGFRIGRNIRYSALAIFVFLRMFAWRYLAHAPWQVLITVVSATVGILIWVAFQTVQSDPLFNGTAESETRADQTKSGRTV